MRKKISMIRNVLFQVEESRKLQAQLLNDRSVVYSVPRIFVEGKVVDSKRLRTSSQTSTFEHHRVVVVLGVVSFVVGYATYNILCYVSREESAWKCYSVERHRCTASAIVQWRMTVGIVYYYYLWFLVASHIPGVIVTHDFLSRSAVFARDESGIGIGCFLTHLGESATFFRVSIQSRVFSTL